MLNVIFAFSIVSEQHLFGEVNELAVGDSVLYNLVLVVFVYIYFNYILYSCLVANKSVVTDKSLPVYNYIVDFAMFSLQAFFLIYFSTNDLYIAGSAKRDSTLISYFFVLVPVDVLFMVYYGFQRDSKYFKYNLAIAIFSSIIRGWSGLLLTVLYVEFCRIIRRIHVSRLFLLIMLVICILIYPLVLNFKLSIRDVHNGGDIPYAIGISYIADTYPEALTVSMDQLLSRFQIISHSIAFSNSSNIFKEMIGNGFVYPTWLEGIHGIALDRILNEPMRESIASAFAHYIDPNSIDVNWNANPTLVGLMSIDPCFGIPTLVYVSLLCWLSSYFFAKSIKTESGRDILWYAWLVYINPGWLGAFILYIYSQALFLHFGKYFVKTRTS